MASTQKTLYVVSDIITRGQLLSRRRRDQGSGTRDQMEDAELCLVP